MRIGAELWEFAERTHPVYERPPSDTRWQAPVEGFRAAGYVPWMVSQRVNTREPLLMRMEGHPSVEIHRLGPEGSAVQTVRLFTTTGASLSDGDLEPLKTVARRWFDFMRLMSHGPFSLATLQKLGHPYGYGDRGTPPAWAKIGAPRGSGSMFRKGWAVKKVRGFVPPLSVINLQSGRLERSWRWAISQRGDGISLSFYNTAPYSWYLAHGTLKMRSHGPWTEAAERFLPELQQAWRNALRGAMSRDRALMGQFGEGYDASGSDPGANL